MVSSTQILFTGLSVFALVQNVVAAPQPQYGYAPEFTKMEKLQRLPKALWVGAKAGVKMFRKVRADIKKAKGAANRAGKVPAKSMNKGRPIKQKRGFGKKGKRGLRDDYAFKVRDFDEARDLEARDHKLSELIAREIIDNMDARDLLAVRYTGKLPSGIDWEALIKAAQEKKKSTQALKGPATRSMNKGRQIK